MEEFPQTSGRPLTILMVDDDETFPRIVNHHLSAYQAREFRVEWRDSVSGALDELAKNGAYDLILTDYNFPTGNGLDFCLQLNQQGSQIPIIFLTGVRDVKLAIDAMKLGVEDFIMKEDLKGAHLAKTIVNVVERVRTRRNLKAVEKRMAMAETRAQAIKDLVVTVCHEFNNPLAAIKISADLVERAMPDSPEKDLMKDFDANFRKIESEIIRLRDLNFEKIDFHGHSIR